MYKTFYHSIWNRTKDGVVMRMSSFQWRVKYLYTLTWYITATKIYLEIDSIQMLYSDWISFQRRKLHTPMTWYKYSIIQRNLLSLHQDYPQIHSPECFHQSTHDQHRTRNDRHQCLRHDRSKFLHTSKPQWSVDMCLCCRSSWVQGLDSKPLPPSSIFFPVFSSHPYFS